jgi:hypothetical protein
MKRIVLSALIASTCVACGGDDKKTNDPVSISCNFDVDDYCDVATALQATLDGAGLTAASCTNAGGVPGTSCSATGRVGRCTITASLGGGTVTLVEHYYPPTYDLTSAMAECTTVGGTFAAN